MTLSALNRRHTYQQFREEVYDLLIIGGGITGAGVALDATKRGMKVALVEMQDFSEGTSSRSTKLVHGGLRYLQKLSQWGVVKTSGQERAIVYENGPHVTTPEHMLLPMHAGGTFGKFTTSLGLRLYDRLAGVKPEERRKMLSVEDTLRKAPLVRQEGLRGGGYYVEYKTDDARLTIEVLKKAVERGATALNYLKAVDFNYDEKGKLEGVVVKDQLTNNTYLINAKIVVNASGPWVESVLHQVDPESDKRLLLTKGAHLVIDKERFPLEQAVYFDTEKDKRMIFAVPRGNKVYVGTTDTVYKDDKVSPRVSTYDRYYIIDAINYMFPSLNITSDDIESSWAGVRPLIWEEGKSPSEVSRKDEIWKDKCGLLTIAGGKLTGYRHMAEEIVDRVAEELQRNYQLTFEACSTKNEPISGGDVGGSDQFPAFIERKALEATDHNLTQEEGKELAKFYGSNVDQLFELASKASPDQMEGLPLIVYIRLMYGLQQEGVVKPTDFFVRRTGALYFNIAWVDEYKLPVIKLMARYFGWTTQQIQEYNAELERALYEARNPVEEEGIVKLEAKSDSKEGAVNNVKESTTDSKASKNSDSNKSDTTTSPDHKEGSEEVKDDAEKSSKSDTKESSPQ